jgi:hypothetical protein
LSKREGGKVGIFRVGEILFGEPYSHLNFPILCVREFKENVRGNLEKNKKQFCTWVFWELKNVEIYGCYYLAFHACFFHVSLM